MILHTVYGEFVRFFRTRKLNAMNHLGVWLQHSANISVYLIFPDKVYLLDTSITWGYSIFPLSV